MSEYDDSLHYIADYKDKKTRLSMQRGRDVILFDLEETPNVARSLKQPFRQELLDTYELILFLKDMRCSIWG